MSQNYERNESTGPAVSDGYYYKTVITYKDGTEKTTNSYMYDIVIKLKKLLAQNNGTVLI